MLIINELTVRIAGRTIIDKASATIPDGARVGLIGRNGAGKTTLFKAIAGDLAADDGEIILPPRARLGRVAQEAPAGPQSLIEVVLAADLERTALLAEAETATDPHRIADIQTRLADINAHSAPARAAAILSGLGFDETAQGRACSEFSGGWRMRVALGALLFSQPDLLLLDEPTNYLDLEGALWLESFLKSYPHTVIIISHDRDLLDRAVDRVLHLEGGKMTLWRGGYSDFERLRAERQAVDAAMAKRQEAQRKHLQAFVDRFKAKATKARQAQSRVKALAKLQPIETIVTGESAPISFPEPERLPSPPVLALDNVTVGYDARPILQRLTLRLDTDDRVALLGPNGNGKSTLIKLIAGRLEAMSGLVTRADKLKVAYFAQHQVDELRLNETPVEHIRRLMPDAPEAKVRAKTAQVGFSGEAADKKVSVLSGGEKARLLLGIVTFDAPHLILLDEPTNHLDIDGRSSLIEAINDFPGAVVMVSHDRHLLEATADRLWLVANGTANAFDGDLDDYERMVVRGPEEKKAVDPDKASRADDRRAAAARRQQFAPLKKEIDRLEKEMAKLSESLSKLDSQLADPSLYEKDAAKAQKLLLDRAAAAKALSLAEEAWLEKSAEYEEGVG